MEDFEQQLRGALRRKLPGPEFQARLLRKTRGRKSLGVKLAALAAMVTLLVAGAAEYRERQREQAGRQALTALRIAAEKLAQTQARVLDFKKEGNQ